MFWPYKAILRELLIDRNRSTGSAHVSIYYRLLLHVVVWYLNLELQRWPALGLSQANEFIIQSSQHLRN
jgi:hypothetical protein